MQMGFIVRLSFFSKNHPNELDTGFSSVNALFRRFLQKRHNKDFYHGYHPGIGLGKNAGFVAAW
jgi:hypothetical protein